MYPLALGILILDVVQTRSLLDGSHTGAFDFSHLCLYQHWSWGQGGSSLNPSQASESVVVLETNECTSSATKGKRPGPTKTPPTHWSANLPPVGQMDPLQQEITRAGRKQIKRQGEAALKRSRSASKPVSKPAPRCFISISLTIVLFCFEVRVSLALSFVLIRLRPTSVCDQQTRTGLRGVQI